MSVRAWRSALVAGALFWGSVIGLMALGSALAPPIGLSCPEDAVIVGIGQYDEGYWTQYECVPLDDIGG